MSGARAGGPEPRGLGDIIVSSRPYEEYLAMFGLDEADVLAGPVLDCPGGAAAFASGVRGRGGRAVAVDPIYGAPRKELVATVRAGLDRGLRYLDENRDSYVWTYFDSPEDLTRRRLAGLDAFAADYRGADEHHVRAALPDLPFDDRSFRLVLSAYLLFSYPDHLDHAEHLAGLRELVRLAREEVRLYPLIDTAYTRYPRLDELRQALSADGVQSEVRRVRYGFQRGADEVLVLWPAGPGAR
ncbi:MAG: hypothetical protein ACR2N6_06425 [Miltoncostaeaceae bacterium]